MSVERSSQVDKIFRDVLERKPSERALFLARACAGDPSLREEVDTLIIFHDKAASFQESPATEPYSLQRVPGQTMLGSKLAHYEITQHLGSGGMGDVYQATDSKLGRSVAIKFLSEAFTEDVESAVRFQREARVLASLNHPNIAAIYGLEEWNGRGFLVLELVEGKTLAERIKRGPIPVEEAMEIATQIAEALEAAHEKGVVHRDLKPANVKIMPDGKVKVKVLDFGLAKEFKTDMARSGLSNLPTMSPDATREGIILGTAAYMSPEQAKGQPVDRRTDIFAFGCVLYEMLTGHAAFDGENLADTLARVLEREPDWSRLPAETPATIQRLLRRALRKDPRQRLGDIRDARLDIEERFVDAAPAPVTPPGRRTRMVWPAALVVAALGVWVLLRSSPTEVEVVHSQITLPENGTIAAGSSNALAVSPDGRRIAFVLEVNQESGVWVQELTGSSARLLPGSEGAQFVLWSPDSKSVAFRVLSQLFRFDLASSAPVAITGMPIGPTFGADWGDDGTSAGTILFTGAGQGLLRVSGSGGMPVAIGVLGAANAQVLPGGRFLYSSRQGGVFGAALDHPGTPVQILKEDAASVYASRDGGKGEIGKGGGSLVWIRGTALLAQPFDPSTLTLAGEPTVIADPAWAVAVSPRLLLYDPVPTKTQFAWVDRDGNVLQRVGDPGTFRFTTMSPDGGRVAVTLASRAGVVDGALWMLDTQRGVLNRFAADLGSDTSPTFSPDGRTVMFGTGTGLARIASNGVGEAEHIPPTSRRLNPTDWSLNGFVLFNHFDTATEMNLTMLRVTPDGKPGGEAKPYVRKPKAQGWAHFSPDGKWVAYESDSETEHSEIFVDTFPEPRGAVQISKNGGFGPRWNPKGGELFYRSPGGKLMAVKIRLNKNSAILSTAQELFTMPVSALASFGSQYDVHPDGNRFLIQVPVKKAPLEVIVNWQALLK